MQFETYKEDWFTPHQQFPSDAFMGVFEIRYGLRIIGIRLVWHAVANIVHCRLQQTYM